MKKEFFENPLTWTINFFGETLSHEIKLTILLIISILFIFFSKRIFATLTKVIKWPYNFIQSKIDCYITAIAIRNAKKNNKIVDQLKYATDKYIKELAIKEKRYIAAQQLLEYPTPKGYCELVKFVVKQDHKETRDNLLLSMHINAKRSWHSSIK